MQKPLLLIVLTVLYVTGCAQADGRIKVTAIFPVDTTAQDYSSWLSDELDHLVPNNWESSNFRYSDITLKLEGKSLITRLALYDYEGVFTDNPASIYAVKNDKKTLIGTFKGEYYKKYVDLICAEPVQADAILIRKYGNNIPQKIQVFGLPDTNDTEPHQESLSRSVIIFNSLLSRAAGAAAFELLATSNNGISPITFASSNPAVISVAYSGKKWIATPLIPGSATIIASQNGTSTFKAAADVAQTINIHVSGAVTILNGKIPIDPKRWFQLTNAANGLDGLFDGNTAAAVQTGWGKIIENYDAYYPVLRGELIDLSGIRMYDGSGNNSSKPLQLSVITSEGQRIVVATFKGTAYNAWVGPDPGNPAKFTLPAIFRNVQYLVINSWNYFPAEIEFYGNYTPGNLTTKATKKSVALQNMFGVNGFEWNFEAPNDPGHINAQSLLAAKTFTGFRHYMDWEKLEQSKGKYTFNPTHSGGWNYDVLYDSCKAAGLEVLACLKTLPGWMLNTYPADKRNYENVPAQFGKDLSSPWSYLEQAKVAFQYAARYGSNKNVSRSLLSVNNMPRWNGDKVNTVKAGLGTVKYIECDNERDKWWRGRQAYQTAYEYAANLSAFYDGHKNTMGQTVGVKNADPAMKVVMAGTASASTDYVKGMVDWCRRYRGYHADGSVNLCWDIINYHFYSNDSYHSQNGQATRGSAPEVSGTANVTADFIQVAHDYANDMPVWVTELGYDVNQGSPFKAFAIGNKSALQTQADWVLRSSLLYARSGVARIFFYGMYDDNVSNALQFSSSGLINGDKTRKPAADYIYQVNKYFGEYTYQRTINKDPIVDEYKLKDKVAYMVVIPDEKGRIAQYTLNLANAAQAKIFKPKAGSNFMDIKTVSTVNGKLKMLATETPVFVMAVEAAPDLYSVNNQRDTRSDVSPDIRPYKTHKTDLDRNRK